MSSGEIIDQINATLAEAVNQAFAALREDGTMQALADKYNLELAD